MSNLSSFAVSPLPFRKRFRVENAGTLQGNVVGSCPKIAKVGHAFPLKKRVSVRTGPKRSQTEEQHFANRRRRRKRRRRRR